MIYLVFSIRHAGRKWPSQGYSLAAVTDLARFGRSGADFML